MQTSEIQEEAKTLNQLSRRKLFAAALPLAALAQDAPPKPTSRDEDLKSARDAIANNATQLAKVDIPIATEPAFVFKV